MKNKHTPGIRFSGFSADWEQHKLGDLCDEFQSGKNIKSEDIKDEGRYPVFGGNGIRGYTNTYNHDGLYALIGRQGALCGNMNIYYGKAYFTEHAIAVKGNNNNETRFIFYLLGKMDLGQYSGQSAQPGLAVNKLKKLSAFIPAFAEQTQVSELFNKLDTLIALHQQELNTLIQTKQGFLQKMFPKEGESVPEIRFPGFTGNWEQRELGEMYDIVSGYAFKRDDYVQEGIPIINGESIQHGSISTKNLNFLPGEFLERYQSVILKTDEIVLGLNRPITNGQLKIAQVPKELNGSLLYQRAGKFVILQNSDINFSYQVLGNEVSKFVLKEAVGSDQPFISTTRLKKWLIYIPVLKEEQIEIGNFFKQLDKTIALHKQELETLKQTKKAFLQKMFV